MLQVSPSIDYYQAPNQYFSKTLESGKRLLLIGESSNGNFYDPVVCTSEVMVQSIFGTGPLLDRFQDALVCDLDGVLLMRMEPGRFDKVYMTLSKFTFDLIYIDGFYFNTDYDKIPAFIEFAKGMEEQGCLIHGFFDVKNVNRFEDLQPLYDQIQQLSVLTEEGMEETGKFFSVVHNQIQGHNAGVVYAGLVANLSPETSPINKTIDVTLTEELTPEQILELRAAGIVCFKNSIKKNVVCTSSATAVATEDSVHKHIANFRIAQAFILDFDTQCDELVGDVGISFVVEKVESILESLFADYVLNNRIKTGSYLLDTDPLQGIVYVSIDLIPVFSVYSITQTSTVRVRL